SLPRGVEPDRLRIFLEGGAFSRDVTTVRPPLARGGVSGIGYAHGTALEIRTARFLRTSSHPTGRLTACPRVMHDALECGRPDHALISAFRCMRLPGAETKLLLVILARHSMSTPAWP